MAVTKGQILKYTLLPGFLPRILTLFTSGFSHLAYYIALIYSMVGLLPRDHPYLANENIGRYGVRHAIAAAAENLVFKRKNIDQIIIFFTVLIGLILILMQIILLIISASVFEPALAANGGAAGGISNADLFNALFQNPNDTTNSQGPNQDIAFILLDRVFGVPGIFESCISAGTPCTDTRGQDFSNITRAPFPYPIHGALHTMLRFYSMGILVVGSFVIIYFVISIVGETASTGTPFGQRFNKAWAPVRIIMFFGLLIPLNVDGASGVTSGLNAAQHMTLWIARGGSNFATNGWAYFNTRLTQGTAAGETQDLIATPQTPEVGSLNQFMLTARTCAFTERAAHNNTIKAYLVRARPQGIGRNTGGGNAGAGGSENAEDFMSESYDNALAFSSNGNIFIRFGTEAAQIPGAGATKAFSNQKGNIFPFCGEIFIETKDLAEPGSRLIAQRYYETIQEMWEDTANLNAAECLYKKHNNRDLSHNVTCPDYPDHNFVSQQNNKYKQRFETAVQNGVEEQKNDNSKDINQSTVNGGGGGVPQILLAKGWAGAAIWYNRIAQMNGAITSAARNVPRASVMPYSMELAFQIRSAQNANISNDNKYGLIGANDRLIKLPDNRQTSHEPTLRAFKLFEQAQINAAGGGQTQNLIINTINAILGTSGIFEIRNNTSIHPLAQLSSIGKGMMDAVVRNTGFALAGLAGESVLGLIDPLPAQLAGLAKNFFFTVVSSTIGIAVILFYVLPFLPFIYAIFALSGWIKSIFEAVVAMPLWALAHLRIDGEGLPGQSASNGYFLLLEIFLRPILIVVGLVATISIFSALVTVLNTIFDLVIPNVGGKSTAANPTGNPVTDQSYLEFYRGPVDTFFFTAMYAIICYMVGLAVFKLIDLIPNSILRWMGVSVATFQENAGDPASSLSNQVYRGSILVSNQVSGATRGDLAAIVTG